MGKETLSAPFAAPCGCSHETRCAAAWDYYDAYRIAATLAARITVGQAYTTHLRMAGLLGPTASGRPVWDADTEDDPRLHDALSYDAR